MARSRSKVLGLILIVTVSLAALFATAWLLGTQTSLTLMQAASPQPLVHGSTFLVRVPGEEDPWDPQARIIGQGSTGVTDPGLAGVVWPGTYPRGMQSAWRPFPLHVDENRLVASAASGSFTVEIVWHRGDAPRVEAINATRDGLVATVLDANFAQGDNIALVEWTLEKDGLPVGTRASEGAILDHEWTPGAWTVTVRARDTRGAWSENATQQFEVTSAPTASGVAAPGGVSVQPFGAIRYGPSENVEDFAVRRTQLGLARLIVWFFGDVDRVPPFLRGVVT